MKQEISFITFAVQDFDSALGFYRDILGWVPFNVVDGTIAFFNVGNLVFSLCSHRELTDDVGHELTLGPYLGITVSLNLPDEAAVDQVFDNLLTAKVEVIKRPTRAEWGGYGGYFADPEGRLWEVAHNPQFEHGADGRMIVP